MFNKLLRIKHWQLFVITVGVPMVLQIAVMLYIFSMMINAPNAPLLDTEVFLGVMIFVCLLIFASQVIVYLWMWAIGTKIRQKIPQPLRLSLTKFKVAFGVLVITLSVFFGGMMVAMNSTFYYPNEARIGFVFLGIVTTQVLILITMVYIYYHLGKTLKLAETKKEVKLSDCIAEMVLIWFYPVGMWILQPRLNKLMQEDD